MTTKPKFVRVQEKGQVTLPAEVRRHLGVKKGDLVAVEETPEGVLITPQAVFAVRELDKMLDEIGAALKEQGLTLEDVIERGGAIREELYKERYGSSSDSGSS
jgi:AbrB family looped-hinge helix DNA binding protein